MNTTKHHGGPDSHGESQWLPELSWDEEFSVFNLADEHEIDDDAGNMYGVLRGEDGQLREIGDDYQELAFFAYAREGQMWHGYPLHPISSGSNENNPPKAAYTLLTRTGLLSKTECKRLSKGKHS